MAKKTGTGFGNRLRDLREAAGLTQAQLADKAGMHLHGLSKLEQGDREPAWATVLALSNALGVKCTAFIPTNGDAPPRSRGRPRKESPEASPAAKPERKKGGK
jgi:transcriptional regulator with XRE-family HTH domain